MTLLLLFDSNSLSSVSASLLATQTRTEMHGHLIRLGIWAGVSIIAGVIAMARLWPQEWWRNFGLQSAAWGAIDAIIVFFGLRDNSLPTIMEIIKLREFLYLNEGLNVGYIGVGIALALAGRHFKSSTLSGAGWGVALQGLALLTMDTILLLRLPALTELLNG